MNKSCTVVFITSKISLIMLLIGQMTNEVLSFMFCLNNLNLINLNTTFGNILKINLITNEI